MRKICVFTGTRAEYGLLKPVMEKIQHDTSLALQIVASGTHLSSEFGLTYRDIEQDGFVIDEKVEILLSSDSAAGICKATGLGLIGFGESLARLKPDLIVILGDRFEALSMASAATFSGIPIAHIYGGETTYGAFDEVLRHAITKMGHLHFTSTEAYKKRVIQLGEHPGRVFNVGSLGVENIRSLKLLSRSKLEKAIHFSLGKAAVLVTFHPVTLEKKTAQKQFQHLLAALDQFSSLKIIFTKANADTDGRVINKMIDEYVGQNPKRACAFTSMGQLRYLSAMKHVQAVIGNSSSGIIEAPSLRVPTVNVGDRQKGRIRAKSVIDCKPTQKSITEGLRKAMSSDFRRKTLKTVNPYEKIKTAQKIVQTIKEYNLNKILKKEFYDLSVE